ncbi:vacuolar protein sorting 38 [Typha latifolia]|uniref:vacuolar protein sorting 38 n=1 Tax=Typha latifolia TaxID=4733 RepID=UPI003C2EA908
MDTNRSDGPDLPSPGSTETAAEGSDWEWVIKNVEEVEGVEKPKVVEWEDLQQELARLWSLSSALRKAKERKESLAKRLESFIELRTESLHQTNELEEMRKNLDVRKITMGDLLMRVKRSSEDIEGQREQLSLAIRMLLVAGKTLSAAHQKLQEANKLLSGERGYGHSKNLQKMQRTREQYMISQIAALYPVKAINEQSSAENLDSHLVASKSRGTVSPSSNVSKSPQLSSLTMSGLQLTTIPVKKMSFFSDKKEVQRSATVLGYVAHAVSLVASYLDVPLRYPLRLGGSRSYVLDYAPAVESAAADFAISPTVTSTNPKPTEFPLFMEGQDTTRAAYAIFLLNKDLEQLLNYIDAESLGPRHVLANLKELMEIIQSKGYIDK